LPDSHCYFGFMVVIETIDRYASRFHWPRLVRFHDTTVFIAHTPTAEGQRPA
jgi:hypothetical protein